MCFDGRRGWLRVGRRCGQASGRCISRNAVTDGAGGRRGSCCGQARRRSRTRRQGLRRVGSERGRLALGKRFAVQCRLVQGCRGRRADLSDAGLVSSRRLAVRRARGRLRLERRERRHSWRAVRRCDRLRGRWQVHQGRQRVSSHVPSRGAHNSLVNWFTLLPMGGSVDVSCPDVGSWMMLVPQTHLRCRWRSK